MSQSLRNAAYDSWRKIAEQLNSQAVMAVFSFPQECQEDQQQSKLVWTTYNIILYLFYQEYIETSRGGEDTFV